jgi:hypothetical protein
MNLRVILSLLLLAPPLTRLAAAEQFIPAGSLIQCTIDDKISSQTIAVGDPVLCQVSHSEVYGRSTLPFGTYLEGRFAEYKDPGRFVGKGWVELKFDKLVLGQETVVPINARVVQVPKYPVDDEGRIHGTGHTTRDIIEWSIPILWPIDLIELPRRGPRVVLKPETQLTLRVMEDLGLPQDINGQPNHREALIARDQITPQYLQPAPVVQAYPQQAYASQPQYAPQPSYQQAPQTVIYNNYAPPQYQQPQQQQQTVIVQQQQPVYRPRPVVVPPPPYPYYVPYGYPRYAAPY